MKNYIWSLLAIAAISFSACTCYESYSVIYPEKDMYWSWYQECYSPMTTRSSLMLRVNESLIQGDTLAAQIMLAGAGYVVIGLQHPLDSVGTLWTMYDANQANPVCTLCRTAPSQLTYCLSYDSLSVYHTDQWHYGCNSFYTITLHQLASDTYLANGTGYVNTDGSADLTFEMSDIRIGTRGEGRLTLDGYAHQYDSHAVYHYTFYDSQVICDETQLVVAY